MSSLPGDKPRTRALWRYAALTGVLGISAMVFACTEDGTETTAPEFVPTPAFDVSGVCAGSPPCTFFVEDFNNLGDPDYESRWTAGFEPTTSVGTGVIRPFLDVTSPGSSSFEQGFNTDGAFNYDQHRTADTNPLPLNLVPEIEVAGGQWREFVLDAHEADNDIQIIDFEVWLCLAGEGPPVIDPTMFEDYSDLTDFCVLAYKIAEPVIPATDQYSSGSGNVYDYRILVPEQAFEDAFAATGLCEYDPSPTADCDQYIIVWAEFDDAQSTFEEFATLLRPAVKVVKTAASGTVVAGNPISFTIVVSNVYGEAEGVMLDDDLPGGTGISWVEDPDNPDCMIAAGPPQHLNCDIGALGEGETFEVTVTSQTTQQSCAVYDNTAMVTSTNAGSDEDDDTIEVITCTGTLQLVKRIINDNGGTAVVGAFGIVTNAGTPAFGAGVADGDNTLKYSSQVFTVAGGLNATFSENNVTGYTEGTWSCTGATATGTAYNGGAVTVPAGGDVVCTITNDDQAASLTLVKVIINDDGGSATVDDFGITTSAEAGDLGWDCETVGDTTTCTSDTWDVDAGESTFAEDDFDGYTEGDWACADIAETSSDYDDGAVTLANGESTTCTIENDDDPAHLTLVKVIINDDGGSATVDDFGITTSAEAGDLGWDCETVGDTTTCTSDTWDVDAGESTFAEIDFDGYTEGDWACADIAETSSDYDDGAVDLDNGESTTCTIENDDDPAHLTLVKVIINDDGGSATVDDFGITTSAEAGDLGWECETVGDTTTCTSATWDVDAGESTFAEDDVDGYTEGTWSCSPVGEDSDDYDDGAVTLANGESTTCTIENDDDPAHITLIKRVNNLYGGSATASDFSIMLNGGGVTFGAGSTVGTTTSYSTGSIEVDAGTQTFSEMDFAGYDKGTWSCSPIGASGTAYNNGSVTLANGESTTCEITNTEQPPPVEETAYARGDVPPGAGPDALMTECFIPDFSNWGWTNQIEKNQEYVWPVYAGASGCSGGDLAGFVTIEWSGTSLNYSLALQPGFTLVSEHVYAGSTMYPQKNGEDTVAPGQYYIEQLTGSTAKWVIYHAVVEVPQQ